MLRHTQASSPLCSASTACGVAPAGGRQSMQHTRRGRAPDGVHTPRRPAHQGSDGGHLDVWCLGWSTVEGSAGDKGASACEEVKSGVGLGFTASSARDGLPREPLGEHCYPSSSPHTVWQSDGRSRSAAGRLARASSPHHRRCTDERILCRGRAASSPWHG